MGYDFLIGYVLGCTIGTIVTMYVFGLWESIRNSLRYKWLKRKCKQLEVSKNKLVISVKAEDWDSVIDSELQEHYREQRKKRNQDRK